MFKTTLLAAAAVIGLTAAASAAPTLTGSFSIAGAATVGTPAVTVDTANTINFGTVNNYTGNSGILGGFATCTSNCGTGGSLTISPFASSTPLFNLTNGISFTLNDLTTVTRISAAQSPVGIASLTLGGDATYNLAGYAPTAGTFLVTTQGNNVNVTFSAYGQAAIPTPEPASLAILGGSLALVGMIRRRRSA